MARSELLRRLAAKYVWWLAPDDVAPRRVIAQVMDIGDHDDVQALAREVGNDALRDVIAHAQPGWFRPRSWAYWHYRLGLAEVDTVPALPVRRFV